MSWVLNWPNGEKEIEKLAADLAQSREALAKAEQRDAETSSEPARTPSQPDAKIAEELEHKTAQVKDLTAPSGLYAS